MPQSAAEFLNQLEKRALVPPGVLTSLKHQVAKAATPVASATIAKLLVEKGHLTAAQAQQLLGAPPASAANAPPPKAAGSKSADAELALLEDLQPLDDLEPLDDLPLENLPADELTPLDEPGLLDKLQSLDELEPLDQAAPVAAVVPLDDLAALDPLATPSPAGPAPGKARTKPRAPTGASAKQPKLAAPATPQRPRRMSWLGLVAAALVAIVLIGGGAAGVFLLIPQGGGEEAFAAAESDYQARQYDAAALKYEKFLADHAGSDQAAAARVRLAAAKVLAARAASQQNWQPALAAAKEHLPAVAGRAEFSQEHGEIAPLVMDMASELATEAAEVAASSDKVAAAREALDLANDGRIVPASVRQWQRLEMAADNVAVAAYGAERTTAHQTGLAAIKKAAEAGEVEAAFAVREKLLAAYPDLAGDASLRDIGLELAKGAASKVQAAEYSATAESAERKSGIIGSVVLTTPLKTVAAAEAGATVVFAALGSVWGLDSATGRVLWRRGGSARPIRIGAEATSDVLLASADGREIIRADSRSGALKWRHSLEAPLAGSPLIIGGRVVVSTRTGQVLALDVQSGAGQLSAQLPQGARVGAVADAAGQHLIQLADHSLLYLLASADFKCQRAVHVGHEPATVVAGPTLLPKHLVIAENRNRATSTLHVLALDGGGLPESVVQHIQLGGQILAPPVALSGKLLVATDDGRVTAYESAAKPTSGLKEIAKADVGSASDPAKGIVRYPLIAGDKLLVAGQGLSLLAPPASGSLKPVWTAQDPDVIVGPPQVAGDTIVTLRRQAGSSGVVVAGLSAANGKPRWETLLGAGIARLKLGGDKNSLELATNGSMARVSLADLTASRIVPLALAANARSSRSKAGAAEAGLNRLPWRDGQIVISPSGTISYVDPADGAFKAEPLQLRIRPGTRLDNCRAAAVGEKEMQLAVSDGEGTLTLVDLGGEGGQQLIELATARLESPPISGLAVGSGVVGVVDRRGRLVTYSLPDLQPGATLDFDAAAILVGPTRIGDFVVLVTDRGQIVGLDRSLVQAWKAPLAHGEPAGDLAASESSLILACRSGWLCKLDGQSGQEVAAVDLGQSLAGTPLVVGGDVIVPTADGAILKVGLPTRSEAAP